MKVWHIAAIWMVMFAFTYPALLADVQYVWRDKPVWQTERCPSHMGMAMLFGLLPPTWVIAPFVTGFYEHGFQWGCPR